MMSEMAIFRQLTIVNVQTFPLQENDSPQTL
jgi:hypothetical protein